LDRLDECEKRRFVLSLSTMYGNIYISAAFELLIIIVSVLHAIYEYYEDSKKLRRFNGVSIVWNWLRMDIERVLFGLAESP
jgi:hypothetical protein